MNSKNDFELRKILFLNGKPISDFDFDVEKIVTYNNYCVAYNKNHFEVYNAVGKCILSKNFKNVEMISANGAFRVTENSLTGVYNYDGTIILPIEFDYVFYEMPKNSRSDIFEKCYLVVKKINNEFREGLYSSTGKMIIPPEYTRISSNFTNRYFHDVHIYTKQGLVLYKVSRYYENGKRLYGFFTSDGKMVIPCEYTYVHYSIQNDLELIFVTDMFGYNGVYSITGEIIIPIEFVDLSCRSDKIYCYKFEKTSCKNCSVPKFRCSVVCPYRKSHCFSLKSFSWID